MAVQQVEVVGPGSGSPIDWVHMHAELIAWDQDVFYAVVAFSTVLLLWLVAIFVAKVVSR